MALQSSGAISFGNIKNEFGLPSGKNIGAYRVSENHGELTSMPLDAGIPQSGQIAFSDFYGKRLNVVIDYYSGGTQYRQNARSQWTNNTSKVKVIGKHRSRPSSSAGKKVFIHVNKSIGSEKSQTTSRCALRTGGWNSGTNLTLDVGSSGRIVGAGGNGGKGRVCDGGYNGKNGTSGLGNQYSGLKINVFSGGRIQAGYAGGGGGGGGHNDPDKNTQDHACSGGGGGGGAGLPAGNGGPGGDGAFGSGSNGSGGSNGSMTAGGGGGGGRSGGGSSSGSGGRGGDPNDGAQGGGGGSGNVCSSGGRSSGSNGAAIRDSSGASFTILSGSSRVYGSTSATGVS